METRTIKIKNAGTGYYTLANPNAPIGITPSGAIIIKVINVPNDVSDSDAINVLHSKAIYGSKDWFVIDYASGHCIQQSPIRKMRTKKDMSQQVLAEKIGVSQKDVSRWETGERNPKVDKLKLIADALECKLDDLI